MLWVRLSFLFSCSALFFLLLPFLSVCSDKSIRKTQFHAAQMRFWGRCNSINLARLLAAHPPEALVPYSRVYSDAPHCTYPHVGVSGDSGSLYKWPPASCQHPGGLRQRLVAANPYRRQRRPVSAAIRAEMGRRRQKDWMRCDQCGLTHANERERQSDGEELLILCPTANASAAAR